MSHDKRGVRDVSGLTRGQLARAMASRRPARAPWVVGVLTGAMALAACTGQGSGAGTGGDTIVIGGVGPLSQPGAVAAGQDMKWAMETAVADVNGAGGLLGRKVSLAFEDTQNLPDVAASVAKKLVEQTKVVGVAGEYHSGAALAQIPVYNQHGTPAVFAETWNDNITGGDPKDPGLPANPPSVFRIAPTSTYAGSQISDWLLNGLKARHVVQIYEATDFGLGQAKVLKEQLDGKGITLRQVKIELNQPDYTAILNRAKQDNANVDVVIFGVTGESSFTVEQNAFSTGLLKKGTICVADQSALDDNAFWRAVPDGVGCVFQFVGPVPAAYTDRTKSVAARYQAKFGGSPKVWVFEAYDAVMLLADAVTRAKSTDAKAVVAALEKTDYVGTQGTYSFPYGSGKPVPSTDPGWLWHQWPDPPIQLVEYTKKGQSVNDVSVLWPPQRQTVPGKAFIDPAG